MHDCTTQRGFCLLLILPILLMIQCTETGSIQRTEFNVLRSGFTTPYADNTVWCYWYWVNDDISKTGITKDLEAMKEAGIGAALIGNINPAGVDGPVPMLSEDWWDHMVHAVNEGKRIGVDIGAFNCPGWSQSGGPWVTSDMAMRHLVYSETSVSGPGQVKIRLKKPRREFQDTHVLAFPILKEEKKILSNSNTTLTANPAIRDIHKWLDGDTTTAALFKTNQDSYTIDIHPEQAFEAKSLRIFPAKGRMKMDCQLQAKVNGSYQTVKEFVYDRSNTRVNVGPVVFGPLAISFPAISSISFRLICKNIESPDKEAGFSEIVISKASVLEKYVEKSLGKMHPTPFPAWDSYLWETQPAMEDAALKIASEQVVDISEHLDSDGNLNWAVPEGEWTILRMGMTPTGTQNAPSAPQGRGYEIDKASSELIRFHFEQFIGELLKRIPEENRSAFKYVIADSYEMGSQNWTDEFEHKFREKYDYDPVKYLPVFSGRIVGTTEESDRFLWDLRRLIADAVAYEYVGGLRAVSEEHGLKVWLENYGHWGFPSEFLMYGGQSSLVSGEFWNEGSLGNIECKAASSAAHTYGKPITSAEAFTAAQKSYLRHPAMLKKRGDWSLTEGINHFVLHLYIHQPDDKRVPGVNAWFSTEFNRHNTWFRQSKAWIDYLRRCQHLLQQGKYAADICYFIGEDTPIMTGARNPELPQGYSYDYINAEVILNRLSVKDGKLVLPDGMAYSLMVLPPFKTMRPEVLTRIGELVALGACIYGQAPERSPSLQNYPACDRQVKELSQQIWGGEKDATTGLKPYGSGHIADGLDLKSTLDALAVSPDLILDNELPVLWTHRTLPDAEIYFLTNQGEAALSFTPSFRVQGLKAQLWNAVSGETRPLNQSSEDAGRTQIPLKLGVDESAFIVFSNSDDPQIGPGFETNFPDGEIVKTLHTSWTVDFANKEIGPSESLRFETLADWSQSENDRIKYYSGTATYTSTFTWSEPHENQTLYLDLGEVGVMATAKLNGKSLGTAWMLPYQLDVSDAIRSGENTLKIEVTNLWRNQMIKDKQLPENERYTWQLVEDIQEGEEPPPSGLIGPVRIGRIQ